MNEICFSKLRNTQVQSLLYKPDRQTLCDFFYFLNWRFILSVIIEAVKDINEYDSAEEEF